MSGRYMPTVTIAGKAVSPDPGPLAVLDGVQVVWGRDGLFDPNEPATATVEILDVLGDYVSDPTLYQAPIVIATSRGTLFRGFVDGIEIAPETITDESGNQIPVWRGTFTAADVVAILARTAPPGIMDPAPSSPDIRDLGQDYWRRTYGTADGNSIRRITDIRTRVAEVSDVTIASGTLRIPSPRVALAFPAVAAGDDLYTLLRTAYASREMVPVCPTYVPNTHTIQPQYFSSSSSIVLAYVSSQIIVQSPGARVVPADRVTIDENAAVASTISNNVSSIGGEDWIGENTLESYQVSGGSTGWAYVSTSATTRLYDISGLSTNSGRTTYDTQAQLYQTTRAGQPIADQANIADLAAKITPYVTAVNGKFYAPPITFDLDRWDYSDISGVEGALLAGYGIETPWTFPGAVYEPLIGWGPFFQLIGAVMTYRDGWQIEGHFAPSAGGVGTLAINQLVTASTPTFNQYAPYISLSTLGTVSGGVN